MDHSVTQGTRSSQQVERNSGGASAPRPVVATGRGALAVYWTCHNVLNSL